MNSCLWFFVLVDFFGRFLFFFFFLGGGQFRPERPRLNTAGPIRRFGGRKSPSGVPGQNPGMGSGGRSPPEAEAFCTFAPDILKNGHRKRVFRYIDIVRNKMKKRTERRKQCALSVVRRNQWRRQLVGTCPPPGVREKIFLARYYAKLLTQHYLFSRIRFGMIL